MKATPSTGFLISLAGILCAGELRALPELEIDLISQGSVSVSWPETEGIVQLETSLNLQQWLPVPSPPALLDGRRRVVAPVIPQHGFFRLRGNAALYVVNQQEDFISFVNFDTARGNVAPSTRLSRSAATGLTQPRATVVTASGRLLISRGNGGILGWNDATTAVGSRLPDIEVNGTSTGLASAIAFAYDRDADRLFTGSTQADSGILVFDGVSSAAFDGDIPPDRTFGPDDRVPFATAGTVKMTIDALKLDGGKLYVVDTSGAALNSSRIMVFNSPSGANGATNPARTITGPWSKVRSIEIANGRMFAVDDTNVLFVIDNIGTASGAVTPKQVTIEGAGVHLRSVIRFDHELYFLDENNASILALSPIPDGNTASLAPDRVIDGPATLMRLPSYMAISRGFPTD